ncbi:MAG: hypothetical protein MEQ84_06705 [Mesorhizobium sp.]|nr:hypothetical protein [Mesorhizobium sp.]
MSERPPATPPAWFDGLSAGEMAADVAAGLALDDFAAEVVYAPSWMIETGSRGTVSLRGQAHQRGARLTIVAAFSSESLEIVLAPDTSGWLSITAFHRGSEVFRAWLDRPYEEYELWPAGAFVPPRRSLEAPGRIGKRRSWISLSADAWPQLAHLASTTGFCLARVADVPDGSAV